MGDVSPHPSTMGMRWTHAAHTQHEAEENEHEQHSDSEAEDEADAVKREEGGGSPLHLGKRVSRPSALKQKALADAAAASVPRPPRKMPYISDDEPPAETDLSGADGSPDIPALNGQGSSCHQCKSRRLVVDLVFCCNMYRKGRDKKLAPTATSSAAHSCRKKYCGACLQKFYNERPPAKRHSGNTSWPCPACRGLCCCAACRRIKARQLVTHSTH